MGPAFAGIFAALLRPKPAHPTAPTAIATAAGQPTVSGEHARIVRSGERPDHDPRGGGDEATEPRLPELDAADAAWAHRAALVAPPPGDVQTAARAHVEQVSRHASVEELAPVLLRKMAWSGDGRRGAARLELGSGSLAGAVVTLEAEQGVVALSVEGLDAREETSLRARLARGLEARGFRLAP